ncbi:MAG TPA: hypothetical protein VNO82_19085 [Solirubrobacteraceae bacterium]|nr:hypothetical protein [Solirubrobacteraceae bacterium]
MKLIRLAVAAFVVALAVPVAASAHPSVYTSDARTGNPPTPKKRYVVANHGFTYVLEEANGKDDDFGVMDYKFMPTAYRNTLATDALLDEGDTGVQVHATCWDADAVADGDEVEDLWDWQAIAAWQDTTAPIEPFYNYIPFQTTSAGLDDVPATWLDDVQTLTGVNLGADPAAQCTSIGGQLVAADTTTSSNAAFNSGLIAQTVEPLEAEKAAALQTAATAEAAAKAATARALAAESALAAERMRFTVKLADGRQAARRVANRGAAVELTGPPSRDVTVRLLIASARAKALGLKSNALGRATTTTGEDGTGTVTVEVTRKAERALKDVRSALKLSVSAVAGDRADTATGTLTR